MNKKIISLLSLLFLLVSTSAFAEPVLNEKTKPGKFFSFTPSYRAKYDLKAIPVNSTCSQDGVTAVTIPSGSRFRKPLSIYDSDEQALVIDIFELPDGTSSSDTIKYFSTPYKICLEGVHAERRSKYRRDGGLSSGILAIPYKFRSGDIASDVTLGPYLGYKFEVIELVLSLGITQIAVSDIGSDDVETETGLTVATGVSVEVAKDWDVALLVGVDHLSGAKGDTWEHQDDFWFSFGIGFNFTSVVS